MISGVTTDLKTRQIANIHKRMVDLQKNAPLSTRKNLTSTTPSFFNICPVLPHLLDDTRAVFEKWGSSGSFDPFQNVYEVGARFISLFDPAHISVLHSLHSS